MINILFLPHTILLSIIWLIVLPLIMHLESRIQRFYIKGLLSIGWASGLTVSFLVQLANLTSDYTISPDFKNVEAFHVVEFKITQVNLFVGLIVSILFTCIILYSYNYMRWETLLDDEGTYKLYFYFLMFTAHLGFQVVLFANDAFLLFIGWEMMVVPGYALVSLRPTKHAADAGYKYAIISSIGSVFILYGISILYQHTGSFNLDVIKTTFARSFSLSGDPSSWIAITLIVSGVGVTAGYIGFQTWIPDAYSAASSPIGGFVTGTCTTAAVIVYGKLITQIFPPWHYPYIEIFIFGGILSMTVGNLGAIVQKDVRRVLAYSSIAQRGYILFAVGVVSRILLFYPSGYDDFELIPLVLAISFTLLEGTLFLLVGKILYASHYQTSSRDVDILRGSLKESPYNALIMIIIALGLAGFPPTIGFFAKITLVLSSGVAGIPVWMLVWFLVNSTISLVYYLKLIGNILFCEKVIEIDIGIAPKSLDVSVIILALTSVGLGIIPRILLLG